ncbi:hypothetical protein B0H14DRAFT_2585368 [Mycena olivaceomarginata]|nr:hypothetical protein B0H14DRAFT_2585368 [Mycena olivaceomarginata]
MGVWCLTVDIIQRITQGCGFFEAGKEAVSWFTKTTSIPGLSQDAPDWVEINFFPDWVWIRFELNHSCDCSEEHQLVMLETEEDIVPSTGVQQYLAIWKQASTSRNCKVLYSVGMGSRGQMWTAGHAQSGSSGGGLHSASWVTTTLFNMLDGGSTDVGGGIGGAVHSGAMGRWHCQGHGCLHQQHGPQGEGLWCHLGLQVYLQGTGNKGSACISEWWRVDQSWGACAAEMAVKSGGSLAHNGTICGQLSTGTLSSQCCLGSSPSAWQIMGHMPEGPKTTRLHTDKLKTGLYAS